MYAILQCCLLRAVLQCQPRRGGRAYQTELYTIQEGIYRKDQIKSWLLWSFLDTDHNNFPSQLNRQPFTLFLQLVKIGVHFQTGTSSLWSSSRLFDRPRSTFITSLCAQVHEMRHSTSSRCTINLIQLICIYGYSFGCFILVFVLCIIPFSWLHWLLMIYGMINSSAFLILNIMEYL